MRLEIKDPRLAFLSLIGIVGSIHVFYQLRSHHRSYEKLRAPLSYWVKRKADSRKHIEEYKKKRGIK